MSRHQCNNFLGHPEQAWGLCRGHWGPLWSPDSMQSFQGFASNVWLAIFFYFIPGRFSQSPFSTNLPSTLHCSRRRKLVKMTQRSKGLWAKTTELLSSCTLVRLNGYKKIPGKVERKYSSCTRTGFGSSMSVCLWYMVKSNFKMGTKALCLISCGAERETAGRAGSTMPFADISTVTKRTLTCSHLWMVLLPTNTTTWGPSLKRWGTHNILIIEIGLNQK